MNPEEKSLLERLYKMTEENNEILRSMRRTARLGFIMRFVYWAIVIGLSIGAFYFIQPYLNFVAHPFGGGDDNTEQTDTSNANSKLLETLQELIKSK